MATTPNRGYELQLTGSNRGRWGVIINNILSTIDSNISGIVEIDCAGSADITVLDSEASNLFQKLTGVLTGNIEVIYPDKGAFFMVENATTGSFTLKIVNVAGGVGVTVAQGDVVLVYTDADANKVILIDNGISTTIATLKNEIKTVYVSTVGGTANAITLTPTTAIASYSNGQRFRFIVGATNTNAVVNVNVSGLGNIPIKKTIGGALVNLAIGDLQINTIADIEKIGSNFQLMNTRPQSHGADIASAATVVLDSATGDYVYITGATPITAVTLAEGRRVLCKFTGIVTITNGANLICPAATNLITVADQIIEFIGEASGVVRVQSFASSVQGKKADDALPASSYQDGTFKNQAAVATTSGTAINFTSIPASVKRITLSLAGVSTNGSDPWLLQIGDSGGYEVSGYLGTGSRITGSGVSDNLYNTGFGIAATNTSRVIGGQLVLTLLDAATNTWSMSGMLGGSDSSSIYLTSGSKALSAVLDRVRLTTTNGVNTFDAGLASIAWEF